MPMADSTFRAMLRNMAWERAKGELRSILQMFYSGKGEDTPGQYERAREKFEAFVREVEENGLID